MTNTTQLVQEGLRTGKLKMGVCDISTCNNEELLYRVGKEYICPVCLDKIGELLESRGWK